MNREQPGRVAAFVFAFISLFVAAAPLFAADVQGEQTGKWTLAASPYIVTGNIIVPPNESLQIEPGVVVKFAGDYTLAVHGSLVAVATPGNRIIFTSIHDKAVFPSFSSEATEPSDSDWSGIQFNEQSAAYQNRIQHVTIRYAKNPIAASASNPALQGLLIENCAANVMMVGAGIRGIQQGVIADYTDASVAVAGSEPSMQNDALDQQIDDLATETGGIRGRIIDAETQAALPAVNIQIRSKGNSGMETGTATGPMGEFEIRNLPADEYELKVSYISYQDQEFTETVRPDEMITLNIALSYTGILFNPITVTASRRPETFLDAPAAISVLETEDLLARQTLNPAEHLKGLSAVDAANTGLNAAVTVVRGFNNVFSGALLSLVDNRITRAPSLRVNTYQFIPNSSEDYDRVEIVLGPGSALYGPNSANGVMHILTKSPFDSPGTTVTLGGGEREIFEGSFRHARIVNDRIAIKLSGQYYQGEDWHYSDPEEARARADALAAGADPNELKIGNRDYSIERIAGDARIDFQLNDETNMIFSGGITRASNVELTGIGASQLRNWNYYYGQARMTYKDLFVQGFVNQSDAGDTYVLRTGIPIVDKSQLFVGQIQHKMDFGERQRFVYGVDVLQTRPKTEGTVNGKNENNDNINEVGAYVQSETELTSKLTFLAAGRYDTHNHIENPVFSPRLALVVKPNPTHSLRLTFNRAFSTPTSNNLFLDILQERTANPLPAALRTALSLNDDIANVRVQGVPSGSGFTFRRGQDGRAQMYSQFDFVDGYSSATINAVWPKLRAVLVAANAQLQNLLPQTLSQDVPLVYVNPATGQPMPNPLDVAPIRETITNNYEIGYKGILSEKLNIGIDVYRTHIEDFVSPLLVVTPTAHAPQALLGPVLEEDIYNRLVASGTPDAIARPTAQQVVAGLYNPNSPLNLAGIPLGVASPEQVQNDVSIIASYRNFGNVWLTGADTRLTYVLNSNVTVSGNYSFVNHDLFSNLDGVSDIALNAPKHKANLSLRYQSNSARFLGQVRFRYVSGFPVNSGTYIGDVDPYHLVDLTLSYNLMQNTALILTIQNLLDNKHFEMVGAPKIGRLAMLRVRHTF